MPARDDDAQSRSIPVPGAGWDIRATPPVFNASMSGSQVLPIVQALERADPSSATATDCAHLLADLRTVRGWIDALEARVTSRVRDLHRTTGAAPAADVIALVGGVSTAEGRKRERRSAVLEQATAFGDLLDHGRVSVDHVDILANTMIHCTDEVRASLLTMTDELASAATTMSPERFGRLVRDTVRPLEQGTGADPDERRRADTFLSRTLNAASGMVEGRFAFHPELAEKIFRPLDREVAAMVTESERTGERVPSSGRPRRGADRARLSAEALGLLVTRGQQTSHSYSADITVIVDLATLRSGMHPTDGVCETGDGLEISPSTASRLLCEGTVTPIVVDLEGVVLAAGRTRRNATRTQRRALRAMYRTCAVDDCDIAFDRCELHHIDPWELGGLTDLDNLVPLCQRHHHVIHDHHWRLHLEPDRTLAVTRPDGTVSRSRPDISARPGLLREQPETQPRSTQKRPAA